MSAVLRAFGREFDVEAFLANSTLRVSKRFLRGEIRLPGHQPRIDSGINVAVSDAGFHDLPKQIDDAIQYLTAHRAEIERLVRFAGVEGVALDFGIAWRDVYAQSDEFPAALVRAAGECSIGLTISHYPIAEKESVPPATSF
jgi:hypothetical protein